MDGTSLPAQDAASKAPDGPSAPYMVIPQERSSPLLGIALALSLALHGIALYFILPRGGDQGAVEQETTAISVNLTHTQVVDSVPTEAQTEQAAASNGSPQPEPDAPQPEKDTPVAEEDTQLEAQHRKAEEEARTKAETEIREKAEAEAREKAEATSRIQAEEEARLKAEQARLAAEAEARMNAEAEVRRKEQEEAQRQAEAEQRRRAEAERKAAEAERREAEQEAREAREDERRKAERDARRKASARNQASGQSNSPAKAPGRVSAASGQMISYKSRVRAHLYNRRPNSNLRGELLVEFAVTASGGLRYARVKSSSGNSALNSVVMSSVRGAAPFPAPPPGASADQLVFTIDYNYRAARP